MTRGVMFSLIGLVIAFWAGWVGADWKRDSLELIAERAANIAADKSRSEMQAVASDSARTLETKLEELKGAIPAGIRTEVVKPVFTNVCVSDEFVRMYNDASDKAERTLSGKSED